MNKSFENRSAMSYASKSYKEECWQKIRNGLHGHRGWGKKGEEQINSRLRNYFPGVDEELDKFEKLINDYEGECNASFVHPPKSAKFASYYLDFQIKAHNGSMDSTQRERFRKLIERAAKLRMY